MLEIEQRVWIKEANIMASANRCSSCRSGTVMPRVRGIAGVSENGFSDQRQLKEDHLSAVLASHHVMWMLWFETEIGMRYEATGGSLEIIADVLQEGFEDPKCFGFAFTRIVAGGSSSSTERSVFESEQKEHLEQFLEQLTTQMGLRHPDLAASTAILIIEWTIARTLMTGSPREAQTARLLFQCLQWA